MGHADDRHAILSIAVKPRNTIQYVLKTKGWPYFIFIGLVSMFSSNLVGFVGTSFDGQYTLWDIIISSFMSSFLLYAVSTTIVAGIYFISAKMLGGKGTFKQMFQVTSLTMIPYIWILPMLLFWMQFAPQSYFDISYMEPSLGGVILQFVGGAIILIAGIWTYAITIVAISEVHKITKWRAFFASILVVVALIVILVVLVLL